MAHHSDTEMSPEIRNADATGQFPEGKLTPEDEGEIQIAIGQHDGKVVIHFGKSIRWVGFTPEQAIGIAHALVRKAGYGMMICGLVQEDK